MHIRDLWPWGQRPAMKSEGVAHAAAPAGQELEADSVIDAPALNSSAATIDPFGSLLTAEGVPKDWRDRAKRAWKYYQEEPIVNNCINAWRTLALGEDFTILCSDPQLKKELLELKRRLGLKRWLKDQLLQLLTKGEAAAFKEYGGAPTGKNEDGRPTYTDFARVKVLNPADLKPTVKDGALVQVLPLITEIEGGEPTEGKPIPLPQFRRWIWDAPDFAEHGTSMILPAFESIELLRDYRRADRAIAKRWATPIRLIQVGGQFGRQVVMPTQAQMNDVKKTFDNMDPKQGAVVPFYVEVKTYGAEGEALKTEEKIKEAKTDIIVAMGFTRALVSGDGSNFSTASMGFAKIQLMLADLRDMAHEMLAWVIDDYLEMKGKRDADVQIVFPGIDLSATSDTRKVLVEMYDRGLISVNTLQTMIGLNPAVETAQMKSETRQVAAPLTPGDIVGLAQQGMLTNEQVAFLLNLAERLQGFQGKEPGKEVPEAGASMTGDPSGLYHAVNRQLEESARARVDKLLATLDDQAA